MSIMVILLTIIVFMILPKIPQTAEFADPARVFYRGLIDSEGLFCGRTSVPECLNERWNQSVGTTVLEIS